MWIILPCAIVFVAALMGIDMLRVPPDMNEIRQDGAIWFENDRVGRRPHLAGVDAGRTERPAGSGRELPVTLPADPDVPN